MNSLNVFDLITTLILGSYAWTVMVGYGLYKLIDRKFSVLQDNHFAHLEGEIRRLSKRGVPSKTNHRRK